MFSPRPLFLLAVPLVATFAGVAPRLLSSDASRTPDHATAADSTLMAGYKWRNIGPDRGGRSIASSGVRGRPKEAYFGAVGGGLWKNR